jgi:hypothetical protein
VGLRQTQLRVQGDNNRRIKSWGTFPNSQHFESRGVC